MLSSPASSSPSGDYIGLESCVDLRDDDDDDELSSGNGGSERRGRRDRSREMNTMKREFPPPIPWLAQTGNLLSHMPWVMKRYHTSDGRLIIRVEKVKHHEYFRAHRANGRLTLHLIPMDDDFYEEENQEAEAEEDDEGNADDDEKGEEEEIEKEKEKEKEEKESVKSSCVEMNGRDGSGGGVKCYMRSISSCMLGMAAAAAVIKPVYI